LARATVGLQVAYCRCRRTGINGVALAIAFPLKDFGWRMMPVVKIEN